MNVTTNPKTGKIVAKRFSLERLMAADDDQGGLCLACGAEAYGVRVKEWRAVKPSGNQEAPYRFNTMAAAEKTLRLISEPFTLYQYRIVEVE